MSNTKTYVKRSSTRLNGRANARRKPARRWSRWLIGTAVIALAFGTADLSSQNAHAMGSGGGGGGGGDAVPFSGYQQNPSMAGKVGDVSNTSFKQGSIIIPIDGCYQRPDFMAAKDLDDLFADTSQCNSNGEKDGGQIAAYSLAYRLVMAGVPLHWAIKGNKTGWHEPDFTIAKDDFGPVYHRNVGPPTPGTNRYSAVKSISYVGAPFIIAAEDVVDALKVIDDPATAAICDTGTCMTAVDLHIAQIDFSAPIYSSIGSLPKLAIVDVTGKFQSDDTNKLLGSVIEALMADLGVPAGPLPLGSDKLFKVVTYDEVVGGALVDDNYVLAWVPPFDKPAASTESQKNFFEAIEDYVEDGGNVLFQDGGITAMEGDAIDGDKNFQMAERLDGNGPTSSWDNCGAGEITGGEDYSDPASQFGGICWTGIGGSKAYWRPRMASSKTFSPGTRRQVYIRSGDFDKGKLAGPGPNPAVAESTFRTGPDQFAFNMATWRHKDNDTAKGRIYYLGGRHWRRNTSGGFRLLLNTILVHASPNGPLTEAEVSRSAPVVATIDGDSTHFQGTFEAYFPPTPAIGFSGNAGDTDWRFPHIKGHLRAIDTADVPASLAQLSSVTNIWDGAEGIPAPENSGCTEYFTTNCRTVFTHNTGGRNPDKIFLNDSTAVGLKPYLGPGLSDGATTTLVRRVLAGEKDSSDNWVPALGGIDRSTVAIIEQSTQLAIVRPTMAYVGASDGMLHAFCADSVGACTKGKELWAFIPRQQLGLLQSNTAIIDGSPTVTDAFGDFDGDGRAEMRTVLTFQTASGDVNSASTLPAVYALDITDPTKPEILWERVAKSPPAVGSAIPLTSGKVAMGAGLGTSMAPVLTTKGVKHLTFVQTNNGGTGGPGAYLEALDTASGEPLWSIGHEYPPPRLGATGALPTTAMPGGAVVFSSNGGGESTADTVAAATIYGDLFVFNAGTSANNFGTGPLFRFSKDYTPIGAPPTIYFDKRRSSLHAIIVTGGYADENSTEWSPSDAMQHAVGVRLDMPLAKAGLSWEGMEDDDRGWVVHLGQGRRAYAQAVVAGNELFVVTDSQDVNLDTFGQTLDTGLLQRFEFAGTDPMTPPSPTLVDTVILGGGGASIDVVVSGTSGQAFASGGSTITGKSLANFSSDGASTQLQSQKTGARLLWVQSQ